MKVFLIAAMLIIVSCKGKPHNENIPLESLGGKTEKEWKKHYMDSMMDNNKQRIDNDLMDTSGLYLGPIQVTKAKFTEKEYSNYKDVYLAYKNISSKKVSAIRFKWYGTNAFGEPADAGGYVDGFGGGFTERSLLPGRTSDATWSILSRDGKKIILAWAYEVAFDDGSKWALK